MSGVPLQTPRPIPFRPRRARAVTEMSVCTFYSSLARKVGVLTEITQETSLKMNTHPPRNNVSP